MKRFHKDRMYGWHFRPASGALAYGDPRVPEVGQRLQARTRSGRPVNAPGLCNPGFHAFPKLASCYSYASYGDLLSFVLLENVVGKEGNNKVSAKYRTILWQKQVPADVNRKDEKALAEWLKSAGFRRASARRKAAQLRKAR